MTETKLLRLLLVEDSEEDSLLLLRELRRGGYEPVYKRVDTPRAMRLALESDQWDIVISDYVMPKFSGLVALEIMKESGLDLPFIIVSGNIGEDIAVAAMKAGAHDYIIKGNLARLVPAVTRELRDAEVRRERRRAEEAFTVEHNFRKAIEGSILVGIAVADIGGRLIYVNKAFCDMVGWSAVELEGATPPFVYWAPESAGHILKMFRMTQEGKTPRGGYELRLRRRNGERFDALCIASPLRDSEGRTTGWLAAFHDISERKQSAESIFRLNRLYSVLSKVNEAIVRISDQGRLYEEVCRIAVEDGMFRMAWIGIVNPETLRVEPVACHGDTGGYLEDIDINAADSPAGRGPTGRAIREGANKVCADIENDPTMALWRDKALLQGFRSCAAFPLSCGDAVIGAFTVYSDLPHFFTGEEINLLSSLSGDISYALETMDSGMKRLEAERHIIATNDLLKLFSQTFIRKEYLDAVVGLLRKWSRCACVGIRLTDENGNIPYGACEGFSPEFLEEENCLSLKKDHCICPRVINEIPEGPEAVCMTPEGSFFSNRISDLFPADMEGPRDGYRSACPKHGFASLAIIPVRYREKILGAIHLADPREGHVQRELIEFIESMTPLMGEAIYRFYIEEAFMASRQQLRDLSVHLLTAREEERTKVAREIHDELGQLLTAASIELGSIRGKCRNDAPLVEKILSVSELIDDAVQDVQRICSELRPRVLDHLGLVAAIEWQADKFSRRYGIKCTLDMPQDVVKLPPPVSTALFRIVQEAFTNVARHAKAAAVVVRLAVDPVSVILEIKDNGRGISTHRMTGSKSFGIMGMHERAHDLGGTVTIKGIKSKGTTITVVVPLNTTRGSNA